MPIIYLSPSTQENNLYVNGGTEEEWMNRLADAMEPYLTASGIRYSRNTPDMTAASSIRASNAGNYDLLLALHSNAAPEGQYGQIRGILVFYYPGSVQGQRAATLVADGLKTLYPLPNRVRAEPTTSVGEVRRVRAPSVFLELGYHDNADDAAWIKNNLEAMLVQKGYRGLDVDFEYVYAEDAGAYAAFLGRLTERLNPLGYPVIAALAPKIAADQPGTLYEGHDFAAIGAAVNQVLLMTYEWGYTYGPPMAVAPLPNVRQVVEYALTEIPASKIWLGVPLYGYDWPLPFVQGRTKAQSISPQEAVARAVRYGVDIQYSEQAQAPWYRYTDGYGITHEVWFEDARSIQAKLALIPEYGLYGVGYWNLMRPFPQNWQVLNALYDIRRA